jgi:hypothetical protein
MRPSSGLPLNLRTDRPGNSPTALRAHNEARWSAPIDCRFTSEAMADGTEASPSYSLNRGTNTTVETDRPDSHATRPTVNSLKDVYNN